MHLNAFVHDQNLRFYLEKRNYFASAYRQQRRLVNQIGQIGTNHAGGQSGQCIDIQVFLSLYIF